ncbi:MAG: hypothetical protein HQ567_24170 [Candidatus Nealsonbacteria bacterium]|nr:hypothetical protein [Candidatus Nealsonbacteria bacterium]
MKTRTTIIGALALLLAQGGAPSAEEAVFVEKGSARSVREIGAKWTQKAVALRPWRATMAVSRFSASGNLVNVTDDAVAKLRRAWK